jgi:hypothetical protein
MSNNGIIIVSRGDVPSKPSIARLLYNDSGLPEIANERA